MKGRLIVEDILNDVDPCDTLKRVYEKMEEEANKPQTQPKHLEDQSILNDQVVGSEMF